MTDQPPPGRPEFDPPDGPADGWTPGEPAGFPPPEAPGPPAPPPPPQPDASASHAFYPGPPPQQPGPPPPPPPWRRAPETGGHGSIVLGLVISLALLGISVFAAFSGSADTIVGLAFYVPVILLVGGIVLAAIPRTTRTGAGILLGIGAAILTAGGLCIALLSGLYG